MLTIAIALAAAAAAQAAPTPAPADLPAWVAEVNRRIEAHLVRPVSNDTGIATVTFRRGADGRPIDVTARGGSPDVSRAAVATIKAMGVLPAMPASMPQGQRISFRFLVGMTGHEDEYETARTAMIASARRANVALAALLDAKSRLAGATDTGAQIAAAVAKR